MKDTSQNKIQECNLSERKLSDGTIQNFSQNTANENSHIEQIMSTNCNDISVKKSDIKAIFSSSLSKDELLKEHTQNFVHKFASKNFCSESKTILPEDKSISISTKEVHIHQTSIKKDVNQTKVNLESKNPQIDSQSIETNSKVIFKRKIRSGSLDRNVSPIKIRKENEVNMPLNKIIEGNIKTSDYEMLSDDELVCTKRKNWKRVMKYMIRERKNYKLLKEKRECRKEKNNKIKKKREKLYECFRGSLGKLDTSESEEEREILSNYLKRNKQLSDELLYDNIIREEIEYIFKRENKKREQLIQDTSANNLQKDMENAISAEIKSDNLRESAVSTEKYDVMYDAITDEEIENASLDKCDTLTNNSQENTESINSDNSCDSIAYTEKFDTMYDAITDEEVEDEASKYEHGMSVNNSQKNIESINSDNSCDSDACTEKYYSMHDVAIDEQIEDEALICERNTSADNSQKNITNAILTKVKSKNSNDSSVYEEKYYAMLEKDMKDASIHKCDTLANNSQENIDILTEVKSDNSNDSFECTQKYCVISNEALICTSDTLPNNSPENIQNAILAKEKSDNLCNSITSTEKCDATTEKKTNDEASICIHDMLVNNSQKNIESIIPIEIKSDNSIANIEKYAVHDITEDTEDASIYKCISANNSQKNIESAMTEVKSDNSCDSTVYVEKNYIMHDVIRDKEVEGKASVCSTLPNNSLENIENAIPDEQHLENFSTIVDMENSSKSDARTEHSKDIIPSTSETDLNENMSTENIHLNKNIEKKANTTYAEAEEIIVEAALQNRQENQEMHKVKSVDLSQSRNMQKHVTSNLELPIKSAYESTSCNFEKKDRCDISQNVENLLLTSNNDIAKDEKTIDQFSVKASESETNSSEKKNDSLQSPNSSTLSSKSNRNANYSLDNHSTDDDNNSDIEVEIKIKPKLKSRVSRKFSLKAPWSAVNTCIKNLNTLKDNPSFLNELFQMKKTSEKSKSRTTSKSPEDNRQSLDDNIQNVTAETEDSNSITKDNANCSEQQQNFQDYVTLNEDRNVMDHNQKGKEHTQITRITTENNLGSSKLPCDTSDVEKQLQKASTENKQKTNEEQNSQDNTTLEGTRSVVEHNQRKETECMSSIEGKMQMTTKNNLGSVKAVYDTSDVREQLSQASSDVTHSKVRVRSIAELSRCGMKSMNLSASIPKSICSAFCQSTSSQLAPPQSASSQLIPPQSASSQLAPPQSASSQSTPLQSVPLQSTHPQSVPLQLLSSQVTSLPASPQSVPKPPSYNNAIKHIYFSSKTNSSVVPVETNASNINNNLNLIQITIKNIYTNVGYCRDLVRHKLRRQASTEYIQRMYMNVKQIKQDLEKLKIWLHMSDVESTIAYINLYMPLNQPLTIMELKNYVDLVHTYLLYTKQTLKHNDAISNASQYPNVSGPIQSNASMPNVNAQPVFRNVPFPNATIPNRDKFMQSSAMPRSAPTIPNINQQQLFGGSANSTQVPYSRPESNIRQQYTSYVPYTLHSRMPNTNQQQTLRNTSHPIQRQCMPSVDMSNIDIQQSVVNMSNVSSNANVMRSYGPVNQGNANVSPTANIRQSHVTSQKNSSTATASAINAQQQKQIYPQTLQINSGTTICPPPMTNQNIPLGPLRQTINVSLPGSFTVNLNTPRTDVTMGNIRHGSVNVNQQQASCSSQVSQVCSEKTQSLSQHSPNKVYYHFVPQSAHYNMQIHPVQNTLPDQSMRQIPQQKLPVNQGNANIPPTINMRQSHIASKNTISSTTAAKIQHLIQSKDTIDLSINNTLQNVQQNVLNKRTEIPELQNENRMQKKAPSTNQQQDIQGTPSVCNISQNISGTIPKTSTSQKSNILQNTMFKSSSLQNNMTVLILSKATYSQTNEDIYNRSIHNRANLTDIQKIILRDQIQSYFTMSDELKHSLNEKELEQIYHERLILFYLYQNLVDYIRSIIEKSQTAKKSVEKGSQDDISQNRSVLQENTIQGSVDKLTKTQSNRDNEISSTNRNLEKQVSDQNIDLNISKNSKSMSVKSNLEVSEKSFLPESTITKESLPKDTRLQEQNNTPKKHFQKKSLVDERPENTEILSPEPSKTSEKNSITEVSTKNSETETQDNAKIKSLKVASLHDKQVPESCPLAHKSPLNNLLQNVSTKKTEDESEIAKNNANDKSSNVEMENVCKTSNVATLNSSGENDATLSVPCDTEDQNKEANTINEIFSENLQDGMRDDVRENIEILNSTKAQSSPLNISHSPKPFSEIDNIWEPISPVQKCESTEISQLHTVHKEYTETISKFCSNAQQEDSMNEQSNNSIDEMSDSSGKLYIDESAEKQEQCDKVSSSEEDNLSTPQDSTRLFDAIRCNSTKVTSLSLQKNIAEADLSETYQDFVTTEAQDIEELNEAQDIEKLNEAQDIEDLNEEPLETEKMQDIPLKFEDELNIEESMIQSIDTLKKYEHTKEDSEQSLLKIDKIQFEEMSLKLKTSEDTSSVGENTMHLISLKLPEAIEDIEEEKMEIDTHSGIKAINEQIIHISEQKYYGKSQTSSCNSVQKDELIDVNVKEAFDKNDFLNADSVECISVKSDDDVIEIMPNILNIRSIPSSLFEKMENIDAFLQNDSLNENDGKSLDINDNLEIFDELDDRPCLRCKRKSMVYCQACLEAHYCSKRCSSLHWNAEHYKQCKGRNSIICIDE